MTWRRRWWQCRRTRVKACTALKAILGHSCGGGNTGSRTSPCRFRISPGLTELRTFSTRMIRIVMMTIEAPIILPLSVHAIPPKEWFHKAITTIMVRLGHLAVEARIEVLEHLFHSPKSSGAIFLVMPRWELMTPRTSSVEDPRR